MTFLQGAIKWSHEGFMCFLIILIFIIVKDIVLYTAKSPFNPETYGNCP